MGIGGTVRFSSVCHARQMWTKLSLLLIRWTAGTRATSMIGVLFEPADGDFPSGPHQATDRAAGTYKSAIDKYAKKTTQMTSSTNRTVRLDPR
jgi:hypothetical protein